MLTISKFTAVPIRVARVELLFKQPIEFQHFYHGNVIRGLLLNLLKPSEKKKHHQLPAGVVPIVSENGRLYYQSGDHYVFGMVFIGNDLPLAERIKQRLASPLFPMQGVLQIGRNAQLYDFQLLDEINLHSILARLNKRQNGSFTIRLLTPLAIDRQKEDRTAGHRRYDQQLFRLDVFLKKIIDRFNNLIREGILRIPPWDDHDLPPIYWTLVDHALTWLELPTNKHSNTYGGVVGTLKIQGSPDNFWLSALLLGSFLHIGEKINFGFGFYDLPDLFPDLSRLFKPAATLLTAVTKSENLLQAFSETKAHGKMIGTDDLSIDELEENLDYWREKIQRQLANGTYKPSPLKGVVMRQQNKIRALAVPTVLDRWLQRAVLNVLSPIIDTLLEDCSFAYRRNFSRRQAQAAISNAYNEGYRYVLEADIENFFDEVDWTLLLSKLRALFPFEPLIDLLEQWIKAPVLFNGHVIRRTKGLPQGAVISPLLSNFFLDEFDERIQKAGFKLIRFADDFVILCKSKAQAEKALKLTRKTLEQMDLDLKDAKTRITNFDEGFRYLGYLFCRSVVLETMKKNDDQTAEWALLDESKIPPDSWLANAKFNGRTIEQFLKERRRQLFESLFRKKTTISKPSKKTVYLGNYHLQVKLKHNQLVIIHNRGATASAVEKIPLETVRQVVLLGPVPISIPTLFKLSRRKIPILMANARGKPQALINHWPFDLKLWLKQESLFTNPDVQLAFCRSIVQAKIHNYMKSFQTVNWPKRELFIEEMNRLKQSCLNKNSIDALRGVEGKAAAVFYKHYGLMLKAEWGFTHRRKHPAPDPVNALLSLGYTVLYSYLSGMIWGQGLNPQRGLYHLPQIGFNALSSDVQEEFRFLVDRLILTLINRRQLLPKDFGQSEKSGSTFILNNKVKALFIRALEKQLNQVIFWRLTGKKMRYLEIMEYQIFQLKEMVLEKRLTYRPFMRR